VINTTEQLGGALGIAALSAIEVGYAKQATIDKLIAHGIHPTSEQTERFQGFILKAEQAGLHHAHQSKIVRVALDSFLQSHVEAFRITFVVTAAIALVAALLCAALVRRVDRVAEGPVFGRRSRWQYANTGGGPGITRHPPEALRPGGVGS
jgi:hypothetical protein